MAMAIDIPRTFSAFVAALALAVPAVADDAAAPGNHAPTSEALGAELFAALDRAGDAAMLARATEAFAAAGAAPCAGAQARVVALAPRADGSVPAYLLSQSLGGGVYGGGHFRLDLAPDGGAGELASFGDCTLLAWDDTDEAENMQVAYLARPGAVAPSEIDVLVSHQLPFALGVVTGEVVWPLIGGSIADPVEADPDMAMAAE